MAMADHQRIAVMIRLDRARLTQERRSDFVARLVKTLAEVSEGPLSTTAAYEEDIITDLGMRLSFSSRDLRDLFCRRLGWYLDRVTHDALVVT